MTSDAISHVTVLEGMRQQVIEELNQISLSSSQVKNQQDLEEYERKVLDLTNRLADLTSAITAQRQLDSVDLRMEGKGLVQACDTRRICKGIRPVAIRFAGGTEVVLMASYWGRKRFEGQREKGLFPELYLLGLHQKISPLLSSQVALAATSLGSFEEARQMLAGRGCDLDIKSIIRITKQWAKCARAAYQELPLTQLEGGSFVGRTVVISMDGGRIRIRKTKRGPKTKKKRNRYSTAWKEPKLLIIYICQPDGRIDKSFLPFIDGTLDGPDAIFALLYRYLFLLNIGEADQILFVVDGARWIWDRIPILRAMFTEAGIPFDPLELIDFYHAVQHLHEFSGLKRDWSEKKRRRWFNSQKKALKEGKINDVIDALKAAAKGSKNKKLRREVQYFVKNQQRFAYDKAHSKGMPIGSGAMESAIRRVVNLRLKSPCLYWKEDTATDMLFLRSYYKSCRWSDIKSLNYRGVLQNVA